MRRSRPGLRIPIAIIDVFAITLVVLQANDPQFTRLHAHGLPPIRSDASPAEVPAHGASHHIELKQAGPILLDGEQRPLDEIVPHLKSQNDRLPIVLTTEVDASGGGALHAFSQLLVDLTEAKLIDRVKLVSRKPAENSPPVPQPGAAS